MANNMLNITNKSKLIACQVKPDCQHVNADRQNFDCDIIALKFDENIDKSKKVLKNILPQINKPLMICGYGKDEVDKELLPELIKILDRECIISYATEKTYKTIVPEVIKGNHYLVLKTPIDINLAKELNILSINMGLSPDRIIINADIGGLGYGYEYGYSIIEKIKQEAENGDEYIDFPIISEAIEEAQKTKEYKTGDNNARLMIEICAASGVLAAGANIIVTKSESAAKYLKGLI